MNLSVVTYYEVLNGLYYKDAKQQLKHFERFAALNKVVPLTDAIAQKSALLYAELRKRGQTIGHNDTLIAGTAISHNMVLITNNAKHFSSVPELSIDNWSV